MKNDVFKTLLLIALPASGKSEVRNWLSHMDSTRLSREFHIGDTLQLDDFPYVHMMRRIDNELAAMGEKRLFYPGEAPFYDGRDWGTLCHLLNEDYSDLMQRRVSRVDSAAALLFDRIDAAASQAGIPPRLAPLDSAVLSALAAKLEAEARAMLNAKHAGYPECFEGKTVIIECARGGPDGAAMPLTGTFGYQYSLPELSAEILESAAILYIWVTPEESRRKNADRADPNDPGSNLHHGVPMSVMLGDYGCDDFLHLYHSNAVEIQAHGRKYRLPAGVFDNREDKTSFLRDEPEDWDAAKLNEVERAIRGATDAMYDSVS